MVIFNNTGINEQTVNTPTDLTIDVPGGFGKWVFMLFMTDFEILTEEGRVEGVKGDIVINSPDFPQWHRGRDGQFKNYWFYYEMDEPGTLCDLYNLPVNKPIRIPFHKCLSLMKEMQHEVLFKDPYWEEEVEQSIRSIHREISRQLIQERSGSHSAAEQMHLQAFRSLRKTLYEESEKKWSLAAISDQVNLSESRMLSLYGLFFNISPIDDLLDVRINKAKIRLKNSNMSLTQIAEECGFSSIYYFSRVFKKRTGLSPGKFKSL